MVMAVHFRMARKASRSLWMERRDGARRGRGGIGAAGTREMGNFLKKAEEGRRMFVDAENMSYFCRNRALKARWRVEGCRFRTFISKWNTVMYRKIFLLMLATWAMLSVAAQDYDKEWKAVTAAFDKDLPATARQHLRTIRRAAVREKNTAQLLRAMFAEAVMQEEIAPDSGAAAVALIEKEMAREERRVERVLWQNALGTLLVKQNAGWGADRDTAALTRAHDLLLASVSEVELLGAAKATQYLPLFIVKSGSERYYDNDLLSVLTSGVQEAWKCWRGKERVIDTKELSQVLLRNGAYYARQGRRLAALRTELQWAQLDVEAQRTIDRLEEVRQRYLDLPENAETYAEICRMLQHRDPDKAIALAEEGCRRYGQQAAPMLRNFILEMQRPMLVLTWGDEESSTSPAPYYPGRAYAAKAKWRNLRNMELRFYRLIGVRGDDARLEKLHRRQDYAQLLSSVKHVEELAVKHDFDPTAKPHRQQTDSVSFIVPRSGVYVVELRADGVRKDLRLLYASKAARMSFFAQSKRGNVQRVRYVDVLSGSRRGLDADSIYLPPARKDIYYYGAIPKDDEEMRTTSVSLFTDRPVYRPGQKTEVGGVAFVKKGDDYKVFPAWKGKITLFDAEGNTVSSQTATADEWGVVSATFDLPRYGRLGTWSIAAEGGTEMGYVNFRVEEYKRPTYTVTLDTLPKPYRMGDRVAMKGRVRSYNDLPIVRAAVKWRVTGTPMWSWRERANHPDFSAEGDTITDADGGFSIPALLGTDSLEGKHYCFEFHAEVLAENGETQTASRRVYLGRSPLDADNTKPVPPLLESKVEKNRANGTIIVREPAFVHYDVVSMEGGVLESRIFEVKDSARWDVAWKPSYGDAVVVHAAYLKNGRFSETKLSLTRPEPDKRLVLKWRTFRSHLLPGQMETWTLSVTHPDGTPAAANVMARLYDASLTAFAEDKWRIHHTFLRRQPMTDWQMQCTVVPELSGAFSVAKLKYSLPQFTEWQPMMFDYGSSGSESRVFMAGAAPRPLRIRGAIAAKASDEAVMEAQVYQASEDAPTALLNDAAPSVPLRENFNETAFFFPRLRTDERGTTTLRFTLPESLTQWNFTALATDKAYNVGVLEDTVVVRKLLMAEAALPRFFRSGDHAEIPVQVRNISDRPLSGIVSLTFIDADKQTPLFVQQADFSLSQGENSTSHFRCEISESVQRLLVRVVAKSEEFSDGEEREIPVLSRHVEFTHSVPFTVKPGEDVGLRQNAARQRLLAVLERGVVPSIIVDTCRDARNEVAKVVPSLLEARGGSSIDVATALYAIEIGSALRAYTRMDESEIAVRRAALRDQLTALRDGRGGWSWYAGMPPSVWTTTEVLTLLARLPLLIGRDDYASLRQPALAFLDREIADDVKRLKQNRPADARLGEWHFRYLYIHKILRRAETPDVRYLTDLAAKERKRLTMYGKSGLAVILSDTKHRAEAELALQSLVEYTVVSDEMGRYFDTERAFGGWASYRIPTQTFAIEALERLNAPTDRIARVEVAQLVSEFRLWLLQSKRTQVWNNSRATADAVYSLLRHDDPQHRGLTWGAVTAHYTMPDSLAVSKGSGFTLERRLEVKRAERWEHVVAPSVVAASPNGLKVGDRVRWVYTLTADRDFDHVVLRSSRPACFESAQPLSGYSWTDALPAYRMVRDSENEYFIEHLAKGKHVFTDEMLVDRAGTFAAGLSTVQCVFAPEFVGNSSALSVVTERPR